MFARNKRQPCVWVPPIPKSNLWESARFLSCTQCPCAHRSPGPNVIVNVYIYTGYGIKEIWVISTVGTNFYNPRESVECHPLRCHSAVVSEQPSDMCGCYWGHRWIQLALVLWGSYFAVICKFLLFWINECNSFVTKVVLEIFNL